MFANFPDFTRHLTEQLGDVIAKAGADIELAADGVLGNPNTRMQGGGETSSEPLESNHTSNLVQPEKPSTSEAMSEASSFHDQASDKADAPVKKKVIKKVIKKVVKKEHQIASMDLHPKTSGPNASMEESTNPSLPHPPAFLAAVPQPIIDNPFPEPAVKIVTAQPGSLGPDEKSQEPASHSSGLSTDDEVNRLQRLLNQLQKTNEDLTMRSSKANEVELGEMRGEFEERIGVLDRKVYALTKERDALKKNSERIAELSTILQKKEETIIHLTQEGEKLSSKQMDLEQHVKKVRQQCNGAEAERDKLKAKLDAESAELEAQKHLLARLDKDLIQAHEQARSDLESQRFTFDGILSKARSDLLEAEEKAKDAANQGRKVKEAVSRSEALAEGLNELREALERQRQAADLREEMLKQDLTDLERRCQAAELRHQDLTSKLPETTRPLLRQIEAMQVAATAQAEAWATAEEMLLGRVEAAEEKAANASEKEKVAVEKLGALASRASSHEGVQIALRAKVQQQNDQLHVAREGQTLAEERCRVAEEKLSEAEKLAKASAQQSDQMVMAALKMEQKARETAELESAEIRRDYEQRINALEQQFASSSRLLGSDSHSSEPPVRAGPGYRWVLVKDEVSVDTHSSASDVHSPNPLPDQGGDQDDRGGGDDGQRCHSTDDGFLFSSILGHPDAGDSFTSPSKTYPPTIRNSRTSISGVGPMLAADAEALRAALRIRQTEFAALNEQVRELKLTRDQLAEELVKATQKSDRATEALESFESLRVEVEASQAKYIAAVELLGERDEVLEELRADLEDVKNLYRDQIEYLVNVVVAQPTPPSSPWS